MNGDWKMLVLCCAVAGVLPFCGRSLSGSSSPGPLAFEEMARIYGGSGEGHGCKEILSDDACSVDKNDETCFTKAGPFGQATCVKATGTEYSGEPIYVCATPPNDTKEKTYEDVPCYRTNSFTPNAGLYGFACTDDPNCETAAAQLACGPCKFVESSNAYTPADSCICEDP